MAQKKTSSDFIKAALVNSLKGGGAAKDWKRRSKSKNDQGQWVRKFQNAAIGKSLFTVETAPGHVYILTPEEYAAPKPAPVATLSVDELIEKMIDGTIYEDDDINVDNEVTALGKELAAQFIFAYAGIEEEYEVPVWIITPVKIWRDSGYVFDQPCPIEYILPEGAEDMNDCGTWVWENDGQTPAEAAKDLLDRGFIWERKFQDFIDMTADGADEDVTEELERIAAAHTPAAPQKGPAPAP